MTENNVQSLKIDTKSQNYLIIFILNYRFDSNVLHEALHKSEYLQSRCGPFDPNTASNFRQVLTYGTGDDIMANEAVEELRDLLLPAALTVFGEAENKEAKKVIVERNYIFDENNAGFKNVSNLYKLTGSWTHNKNSLRCS